MKHLLPTLILAAFTTLSLGAHAMSHGGGAPMKPADKASDAKTDDKKKSDDKKPMTDEKKKSPASL